MDQSIIARTLCSFAWRRNYMQIHIHTFNSPSCLAFLFFYREVDESEERVLGAGTVVEMPKWKWWRCLWFPLWFVVGGKGGLVIKHGWMSKHVQMDFDWSSFEVELQAFIWEELGATLSLGTSRSTSPLLHHYYYYYHYCCPTMKYSVSVFVPVAVKRIPLLPPRTSTSTSTFCVHQRAIVYPPSSPSSSHASMYGKVLDSQSLLTPLPALPIISSSSSSSPSSPATAATPTSSF